MALKWDDLFYCIAYDYSCADWDSLCDHLRDVHGKISLNSELLLLMNSVSGFMLANIRSSLTHLHGFHLHCIVAKRLLRLPNLRMVIKQESIISQKLGSKDFGQIASSVLNKGKFVILPPLNSLEVLSSASDKAKLFARNFSNNFNLDDSGISLPVFSSRTNLKLHSISATPKMVEKVIRNHDLSNASGPDCIQVVVLKNCEPELS